jgi:hypothetical protein
VGGLTDSSRLQDLCPHLSAKEIEEQGVQICEKSLNNAYRPGTGRKPSRISTARNYGEFLEEARTDMVRTCPQNSNAHSAGYRQKDGLEVTANSEVDDNEKEYTW